MAEPTPSPKTILRGHKAQVHAAAFIRDNERLATGDAEGYVVLWDLTIMRARAVWKAHESAILGVRAWSRDRLITHGRDHKLIVWKVNEEDELRLSSVLPLDDVAVPRPQPWVLHLLEVNTMNFCSFAMCSGSAADTGAVDSSTELLIAVPNTLASESVDIYTLPSQTRIHTIKPGDKNGMAMCLSLFHSKECLTLVAGFENGCASVHRLAPDGSWSMVYRSQAHSQPILSLDVDPTHQTFLTSGADAIIAKHPIPESMQEVIVDWNPKDRIIEEVDGPVEGISGLASALRNPSAEGNQPTNKTFKAWEHPLKTVNTKHAGQQGLIIRSDGRIFATAGWDSKIRVYSSKTLKELAVLQWHKVGCYAVAFANLKISEAHGKRDPALPSAETTEPLSAVEAQSALLSTGVKDRRINQAMATHWIAAGAKDGKVSLWDIY